MAAAYQRMLTALLPPGKLWRLVGGSLLSSLFLACANELERIDGRAGALIQEADPRTALELLPEYERELDLEEAATVAERQARIVALTIAEPGYRPQDLQTALAPLLGAVTTVLERTTAMAASMGDVREIFRFFLYRNPTLPGTYYLKSAQELLDTIKPTHTAGYVIESIDFLCDDEFSLCDSDLLGA